MQNIAALPAENARATGRRPAGAYGAGARRSQATKAPASASPAVSGARTSKLPQPAAFARTSAHTTPSVPTGHERQPQHVERRPRAEALRDQRQHKRCGDEADRDVEPEHPLPGETLDEAAPPTNGPAAIQVPNAPFGLSWYQGDLTTDDNGVGVADFIGRFSIETFIVAPNTAPAPVVFTNTPFPDVNSNPPTGPVHTYHVGLWFGSAAAAQAAGCPNTVTPFNGEHTAGIQALSTRNFAAGNGPLRKIH